MSDPSSDKSSDVKFDDFMSQSDTAIWMGERDPRLRSTIVSVWILDRMPDEGDFEDMLAESVEAIPRLRQRVVRDRYEIAPPRWEKSSRTFTSSVPRTEHRPTFVTPL